MVSIFCKRKTMTKGSHKILLNNKLDEQIQSVANSLNFPLHLFFASKYSIKNYHIYPRGNIYHFIAFSIMIISNILTFYRIVTFAMTDTNMTNLENNLIRFFTTLYFMIYVGNFILTFVLDTVHRYDNVFLILGIQNINRNINISNSIKSYIIWNWIFLIAIISINMYICVTFYTLYLNVSFTKIMVQIPIDYMFFVFDVSYVICIRFIVLLKKYLDEWVEIVLKIKDRRVNDDEQCLKLFRLYQNILMVYNLYKENYELLVSTYRLFGNKRKFS